MKKTECTVDVPNGYFKQEKCQKVDFHGKIGCFRIATKETVAIPPRSEVVSYWHVTGFPESYQNEEILGFLEPAEKFV